MRKRAKSSITQPWIIRFSSDFVQSLNTGHPKFCKSSRSRGQRSRLQRDIMCAKIRKIISYLAVDCFISHSKAAAVSWVHERFASYVYGEV